MKRQPRLAFLSLCTLAFVMACSGDSSGPPAVASVDVAAPGSDLQVGGTLQLTATARDAKGTTLTGRTIAWTSASSAIATVSSGGVVTGVAVGSAVITATIEGKSGSQTVTVVPPPVASVSVTVASGSLQVGQTTQATAVTRDANNNVVTGRTISWSSTNPQIASVSTSGVVTALTAGSTTIIATSESKSGSAQVTVSSGNPADAPQITAVTPTTLVEGQAATITGSKFGATPGENVVRIGGVAASVTAASATSLQIIVPNLNCKPAQSIAIDVTVGGNTSAAKSQAFAPASTFALAQGQQRVIATPTDFCLQFPAATGSETYLIGVQSIVESATSVTPAVVTGAVPLGAITSAAATVSFAATSSGPLFDPANDARSLRLAKHRAVEMEILAQERALMQPRFQALKAGAHAKLSASASMLTPPTVPGTAKVGDVLNIKVPNRNLNTCANFIPIAVTVKAVGDHSIILEDNANPAGGFSTSDYQTLSTTFENKIYPTDESHFGTPTDFDSNGRVAIVITKEVNKTDFLLGVVYSANFAPQSLCASSNEGEFFYGRAPDPTGAAGKAYPIADALADAPLIIGHEFTHVIQFGHRVASPTAEVFLSVWEAEGQATLAEEVNGYAALGLGPNQNLGYSVAFNDPAVSPTSWFVDPFVDLAIYYGFQTRDSKFPGAPEQCSWLALQSAGNNGPCLPGREVYGVPWSFLRWISDQYGTTIPGGTQGFQKRLIDSDLAGFANVTAAVGVPIDVLLTQWSAALYTDDRVAGIDPKLTFTSWNLVAIESRLVQPARLTPYSRPFGAFNDQVSVRGGSTAYFLVSGSGRSATGVRVRDTSDGPLPDGMRLWVVRLQ